jgi:hypothetical protein
VNPRAKFLHDFFEACYPNRSRAEIDNSLRLLSESETQFLFEKIFQRVHCDEARYAAEVFSQNGWFMDMNFPAAPAPNIAEHYEKDKGKHADAILSEYYRRRVPEIRDALILKYPGRSRILTKAFRMHLEMEYDICVPLFLIHADGICKDVFGRDFFKINKNGLAARPIVDGRKPDWVWDAVTEPFRLRLPLAKGCKDPNAWNRHVILHGRNVDYGSEINSLKAISLLSFLCSLDNYLNERETDRDDELDYQQSKRTCLLRQ